MTGSDSVPNVLGHVPVLLREVLEALSPRAGGVYVDMTLGGGGHTEAMLRANPAAQVLGFDRDPSAVVSTQTRLASWGSQVRVIKGSFSEVEEQLDNVGIERVDGMLADLGVSSWQLNNAARGMSFRLEGPLDMRMDPTQGETASELIERLSSDELATVLYEFGEERRSRRIARCIKQSSEGGDLLTTLDLRRAVVRAVGPARIGGIDPATRTFQALRIAVNQELEELAMLLSLAVRRVAPGGVFAVITFHSLEDRLVKRATQNREVWAPLTKKPVVASAAEIRENPRARSAKLRAARRLAQPYDDVPVEEGALLSQQIDPLRSRKGNRNHRARA